jgi:hypothetical protein
VRKAKTPSQQAEALHLCGYATDPKYGAKIISIIQANKLTQYDELAAQIDEKPAATPVAALIPINLDGVLVAEGLLLDNKSWVPARVVGEALQIRIGWNGKAVTANGKKLPTQLVEGKCYVPVRDLASASASAKVQWNKDAKSVDITTE